MITVATWNLENFFHPDDEAGPAPEAAYEAKLKTLADVITQLASTFTTTEPMGEILHTWIPTHV